LGKKNGARKQLQSMGASTLFSARDRASDARFAVVHVKRVIGNAGGKSPAETLTSKA
jgi:hypothetical protein